MVISSTEQQPAGAAMSPRIAKTFGLFFVQGYRVFTADEAAIVITPVTVQKVMAGAQRLGMHNFVFMGRERLDLFDGQNV